MGTLLKNIADNYPGAGVPILLRGFLSNKWDFQMTPQSRVYFLEGGGLVKIGVTIDMERRMKDLRASSPVQLTVITSITGDVLLEGDLHATFGEYRKHGEWFAKGPRLEEFLERIKGYEEDRTELEQIIIDSIEEYGEPLWAGEDIPPVAYARLCLFPPRLL